MELPDSFIIEIENGKVDHLISEFSHDFELMAKHLKIMNKRMVLLNPVSIFFFNNNIYFVFLEICDQGRERLAIVINCSSRTIRSFLR